MYFLMFGETNLFNIPRCPQIDRGYILLYLSIVTGLTTFVIQKKAHHLNYPPRNDHDSQHTDYYLPTA